MLSVKQHNAFFKPLDDIVQLGFAAMRRRDGRDVQCFKRDCGKRCPWRIGERNRMETNGGATAKPGLLSVIVKVAVVPRLRLNALKPGLNLRLIRRLKQFRESWLARGVGSSWQILPVRISAVGALAK